MPLLLGRDAVIARIAAAVERARDAGGGIVVVSGPAGVGTTGVVEEAMRPLGSTVARGSAALPAADAAVWWSDDAQRMPEAEVQRLCTAPGRVVVLSGRAPWAGPLNGIVRAAMRVDPRSVIDVDPLPPELVAMAGETAEPRVSDAGTSAISDGEVAGVAVARVCGSRFRLFAAVRRAEGNLTGTAVRLAVDDLLADLSPAARSLLEAIAVGGECPRTAAVEEVWAREPAALSAVSAGFDDALTELAAAGLVGEETVPGRLHLMVSVMGEVVVAGLGAARAARLHVSYAETLGELAGIDPREIAAHIRPVADRMPRALAAAVLTASAERRAEASDQVGAVADLAAAAALLESAAGTGSTGDDAAAFAALHALGVAIYQVGDLDEGERAFRRAERFAAAASPAALAELELFRTYIRADRGQPAELPGPERQTASPHPAEDAVLRLFLVDRGDDVAALEAVCATLVTLDHDGAGAVDRGAAALGRSVRASLAGDLDVARAEADWALSVAGDTSAVVFGGIQRELIRLCVLRGDLEAAQRHADGDGYAFAGRVPRIVEASSVVHSASVLLLRGDVNGATVRAEEALAMTRLAPVPRGLVRCVAWVALLSAMRGDLARARSLVAEAGRGFPLDGNLRLVAIMHLARVQLALRDGGPMPPSAALRLERTEGASRLLLPVLLARLGLQHGDDATVAGALAELDRIDGSPPARALAERIRALQLVPTRRRREAADRLGASAAELARLGFRGLAAETRLEWAELVAEVGEPAVRSDVVDLVHYFDTQGLDDWGDRARRLARTLGVRVGGRRGGTDQLTRREAEVVGLVLEGLTNAEIARRLYLSERTVETHLQHVYRRLEVDSRLGLVAKLGASGDQASGG